VTDDVVELSRKVPIGIGEVGSHELDVRQLQRRLRPRGGIDLTVRTVDAHELGVAPVVRQRQQISAVRTPQLQHPICTKRRTRPAMQQRRQRHTFWRRPLDRERSVR
jgi:hypothetical protein